ncbi:uncharacterized protein LY89DRAFT_706421 [Mollisia scopiformis]|uniref:Amidohydrolase-related domain-containing protein n=1 Tax=Mollisia scopiformis TaxID=149040 RepID=A0A194XF21_MOLSC|nr:uncharacterized protein LY89DRAFT_706421 [Mollisia scopiformis]KUJ18763.1 hypothetical protein LY89DRAFT_706421 [Mollisia scopiformis]
MSSCQIVNTLGDTGSILSMNHQYRDVADLLIPGRVPPISKAAVVVHNGEIEWAGVQSSIPIKHKGLDFIHVPVLMPGLWDCHVHYFGSPPNDSGGGYEQILGPIALFGARTVRDLERTLLASFTSVRELGGYGGEIAAGVEEGNFIGPHIYSSIAPLSITAGHGDIHRLPLRTVLDGCAHGLPFAVSDGVPECIKTVRQIIRRGAKIIKVCVSGGVVSVLDDPEDAEFSPEELKAIVEEAGRSKRALNAGVKTIEHGSYLDEECIALMKKKNAILVPTASIIEGGWASRDYFPPETYKKFHQIYSSWKGAYSLAIASGVKIALGTDQANSQEGTFNSHGSNGKEIYFAVQAGMSPLAAIEACTATAPETLGEHIAPKSGQILEGYDADLIALSQNPLNDVSVLSDPDNVTHVWKMGNCSNRLSCCGRVLLFGFLLSVIKTRVQKVPR